MASLLGWAGNQVKRVGAEINPFDGGKSYGNPTGAPVVPQSLQGTRTAQAIQQGRLNIRAPMIPGNLRSGQVIPANLYRIPIQNSAQLEGQNLINSTGLPSAANWATAAINAPRINNLKGVSDQVKANLRNEALGQAGITSTTSRLNVAKRGTLLGAQVGANILGAGSLKTGAEAIATKPLLPTIAKGAGIGATYNAGATAANLNATPKDILKAGAMGALLGAGIPAVAGGASRLAENPAVRAELGAQRPGFAKIPSKPVAPPVSSKYLGGSGMIQDANGHIITEKDISKFMSLGASRKQAIDNLVKGNSAAQEQIFKAGASSGEHVASEGTAPIKLPSKAAQTNPIVNQLGNKGTILKQIKGGGEQLNNIANKQFNDQRAFTSEMLSKIPTVTKLGKKDFTNFVDTIEGRTPPGTPAVEQASREWKNLAPQIRDRAVKAGLPVGNISEYFPREYDPKVFKDTSTYNRAVEHLVNSHQAANKADAVQLLSQYQKSLGGAKAGHLEYSRGPDLPTDLQVKTKDVLGRYVESASGRVTRAENFGVGGGRIDKLVGDIAKNGGDAQLAKKTFDNIVNLPDQTNPMARVSAKLRQGESASRMGLAGVSHAGQTLQNTATMTGYKNFIEGWGRKLARKPDDKAFITEAGTTAHGEITALRKQQGLGKITAPAFEPIMKANREAATLAGRAYGDHLAKIGDTQKLEALGVTGDIGKTLTRQQQVEAARGVVDKTLFRSTPLDTPNWAETTTGKNVGQFRMGYAFKQPGFVYNQVIKEAGKGNLAPLARYATTGLATGYATARLKQGITGRKESPAATTVDTLAGLGGLPAEAALQIGKYFAGNPLRTVAGIGAPLAGEAVSLGDAAKQSFQQKSLTPLERDTLKRIPFVGGRAATKLTPTATQKNAAAVTAAGANPSPVPGGIIPGVSAGNAPDLSKALAPQSAKVATAVKNSYFTPQENLIRNASSTQLQQAISKGLLTQNQVDMVKKKGFAVDEILGKTKPAAAQLAAGKINLGSSSNAYQVVGNTVLRKDAQGNITSTPKIKFDYQVGTAQLVNDKNSGNLKGYIDTANKQLQSIQTQLQDPSTDPLEAISLQNEAQNLQDNIDKYTSYGGFKAPKTNKGTTAGMSGFNTAGKIKAPKAPRIAVRAPRAFKAGGSTRKLSVSKIPSNYTTKRLG